MEPHGVGSHHEGIHHEAHQHYGGQQPPEEGDHGEGLLLLREAPNVGLQQQMALADRSSWGTGYSELKQEVS